MSCPRCKTLVEATPGTMLSCPTCGFAAAVPATPAWKQVAEGPGPSAGARSGWAPVNVGAQGGSDQAPHGSGQGWGTSGAGPYRESTNWQTQGRTKPTQGIALAALLINVLLIPGLGSIIGGRTKEGLWQLALSVGAGILAVILVLSIIGIVLLPIVILAPIAGWIWGLITGIQLLQEAQ